MAKKREPTNLAPAKTPLGQFVRAERDARAWSQDELAARAGNSLTFTSISNIERGKVGLPDPPTMIALANAFGMHVCDLYVRAGYPQFAWSVNESDDDLTATMKLARGFDARRQHRLRRAAEYLSQPDSIPQEQSSAEAPPIERKGVKGA